MIVSGNGSIVPLEKKSKYKCRKWRLYVSTDSGQRTRVVRGTWTEACEALEAFKDELANQVPPQETFAAYTASWLSWRDISGQFAPGTIANNKREIAALNRTELSELPLDKITPETCRAALLWLKTHPARSKSDLSNTTMNKLHITLHSVLQQAVDDERITRNPMDKVPTPKPDTKEKQALTPDELFGFVGKLEDIPLDGRVMTLYLMALLGLRRAEACAISDADIDGEYAYIHLAIKERNGAIGEPKSKASIRRLPCPAPLTAKVDEWRRVRASKGWQESPTLCCNSRGGIIRPQLLQRWWTGDKLHNGVREALGCPDITLHQLRHSNLSMMARLLSPFDLQRYAGWSSIEPARIYIHDDMSMLERAIRDCYQ